MLTVVKLLNKINYWAWVVQTDIMMFCVALPLALIGLAFTLLRFEKLSEFLIYLAAKSWVWSVDCVKDDVFSGLMDDPEVQYIYDFLSNIVYTHEH